MKGRDNMLDYTIGLILTLVVVLSIFAVVAILGATILKFLLEPFVIIARLFTDR